MRLSVLGFFLFLLTVDLVPAAVAVWRIQARPQLDGKTRGWHIGAAIFGALIAGMLMNGATVQTFLTRPQQVRAFSRDWQVATVVAAGVFGSACATAAVCMHLRLATRRDPDYGPMEKPPKPEEG
jgi:hypothetical protein